MKKLMKFFLYSAFSLTVSGFFIYYLFPSKEIEKFISAKVVEANPDLGIKIDNIKPVLPPGINFYSISMAHRTEPVIDSSKMKVSPRILTLTKTEKIFDFDAGLCEGKAVGNLRLIEDKKPGQWKLVVNSKLAKIKIDQIQAVKRIQEASLTGTLDGTVRFESSVSGENFSARFIISDSSAVLAAPLYGIKKIDFKSIDADIKVKNRQNVKIDKCVIKGKQVSGNISGTILAKQPVDNSVLNLKGKIVPDPFFIKVIAKIYPAASLVKNGMEFTLTGTVKKPKFLPKL